MCSVFTISQAFAISGGPVYPTPTPIPGVTVTPPPITPSPIPANLKLVGTYAGMLQPAPNTTACAANSIGLFSVTVPATGLGSGAFVMFNQGRIFSGSIQAEADPVLTTLTGILDATFNFSVTVSVPVTTTVTNPDGSTTTITTFELQTTQITASANGIMNATITTSFSSSIFGLAATRINGAAHLDISQGDVNPDLSPKVTCSMDLTVVGFKQSAG